MILALKFLGSGGIGLHSGFAWPLPKGDGPGDWVEAHGQLEPCGTGVHACRLDDLPYWIDDELWAIELDGEVLEEERGLVARRGRLLRRISAWDEPAAAELARSCAERARATALAVLSASDLEHESEAVRHAAGLEQAAASLVVASRRVDGFPGRVAGYAADVTQYAIDCTRDGSDWASCAAYAGAFLAGFVASGGAAAHPDHEAAFHEARSEQAAWLARRLGLGGEV